MFHLVEDNVSMIENNLIWVRNVRDSVMAWWFNVSLLVLVIGCFGYFLWAGYGKTPPPELQKVEFKAVPWQNAVRNVPITDYGQTPAIETGDGIPGYADRTSATAF